MEENKKKSNILIYVILVLLLIAVGIGVGYLLFNNKEKVSNNEKDKTTIIEKDYFIDGFYDEEPGALNYGKITVGGNTFYIAKEFNPTGESISDDYGLYDKDKKAIYEKEKDSTISILYDDESIKIFELVRDDSEKSETYSIIYSRIDVNIYDNQGTEKAVASVNNVLNFNEKYFIVDNDGIITLMDVATKETHEIIKLNNGQEIRRTPDNHTYLYTYKAYFINDNIVFSIYEGNNRIDYVYDTTNFKLNNVSNNG